MEEYIICSSGQDSLPPFEFAGRGLPAVPDASHASRRASFQTQASPKQHENTLRVAQPHRKLWGGLLSLVSPADPAASANGLMEGAPAVHRQAHFR